LSKQTNQHDMRETMLGINFLRNFDSYIRIIIHYVFLDSKPTPTKACFWLKLL